MSLNQLLKPDNISRRGFLRLLGLTVTTVVLGEKAFVEAAPEELVGWLLREDPAGGWERVARLDIAEVGPKRFSITAPAAATSPMGLYRFDVPWAPLDWFITQFDPVPKHNTIATQPKPASFPSRVLDVR